MTRSVVRLVINLDVEGPVFPEALADAHKSAEDAACLSLDRFGATRVVTLPGTMTKTVPRAKRAKVAP